MALRRRLRAQLSTKAGLARKAFQESLHPRTVGGKFADKPGAHMPGAQKPAAGAGKVGVAHEIKVLAAGNPKKPGTKAHARFALYAESKTVGDYLKKVEAAGFQRKEGLADLAWDAKHGFVSLHAPGAAAAAVVARPTTTGIDLGAPKLTTPKAAETPPLVDDAARWSAAAGHTELDPPGIANNPTNTFNPVSKNRTKIVEAAVAKTGLTFTGADDPHVAYYTGSGNYQVNRSLREGATLTKTDLATTAKLDSLIADSTLKSDLIVYRGIGDKTAELKDAPPPEFYDDLGFSSTSMNPAVSHGFASSGETGSLSKTNTMLQIRLPKGHNAAFIGRNYSAQDAYSDEAEVLLARGTRLRVIKREQQQLTWEGGSKRTVNVVIAEPWTGPVPAGASQPIVEPHVPHSATPLNPLRARFT